MSGLGQFGSEYKNPAENPNYFVGDQVLLEYKLSSYGVRMDHDSSIWFIYSQQWNRLLHWN